MVIRFVVQVFDYLVLLLTKLLFLNRPRNKKPNFPNSNSLQPMGCGKEGPGGERANVETTAAIMTTAKQVTNSLVA